MNLINSFFTCAMLSLVCVGCTKHPSGDVEFHWLNLSTNEIWITDVSGIPKKATAGRLELSRGEDRPHAKAYSVTEKVRIPDQITLTWIEGRPGDLEPGRSVSPEIPHTVSYKRDELGLPPILETTTIRFTYLGTNRWRVESLE